MSIRARSLLAAIVVAALQLLARAGHSAGLEVAIASEPVWDPVRAEHQPLAIPGSVLEVSVTLAAVDVDVDGDSMLLTLPIPDGASLVVDGPLARFEFARGDSVAIAYSGASASNDDVAFSSDGGSDFGYIPAADADGADPAITNVQLRCRGALPRAGTARLVFRVRVDAGRGGQSLARR